MSVNLLESVISRKVCPVHPGEVARDILDERDISLGDFFLYNLELDEIMEGDRPMTWYWAKELEEKLEIGSELLMRLQRKVDIWDSYYETN